MALNKQRQENKNHSGQAHHGIDEASNVVTKLTPRRRICGELLSAETGVKEPNDRERAKDGDRHYPKCAVQDVVCRKWFRSGLRLVFHGDSSMWDSKAWYRSVPWTSLFWLSLALVFADSHIETADVLVCRGVWRHGVRQRRSRYTYELQRLFDFSRICEVIKWCGIGDIC